MCDPGDREQRGGLVIDDALEGHRLGQLEAAAAGVEMGEPGLGDQQQPALHAGRGDAGLSPGAQASLGKAGALVAAKVGIAAIIAIGW